MKILKYLLIGVLVLVVLIFIVSLFFSSKVHVERTVLINAPVDVVFPQVNSVKNMHNWDPWAEKDPAAVNTFEGPEYGVGAIHKWTSKVSDVGNGTMTITESVPNDQVKVKLEFEGRGEAMGGFQVKAIDGGTNATWSLDMDAGFNPIMRIMGGMMDKMVGPDFEKGLGKLKVLCESAPKTTA